MCHDVYGCLSDVQKWRSHSLQLLSDLEAHPAAKTDSAGTRTNGRFCAILGHMRAGLDKQFSAGDRTIMHEPCSLEKLSFFRTSVINPLARLISSTPREVIIDRRVISSF